MTRVLASTSGRGLALYRSSAEPVEFGAGFYEPERDDVFPFRWMQAAGELVFASRQIERFVELWVFCCFQDLSQQVSCTHASGEETVPLPSGWGRVSIAIPAGSDRLTLAANKLLPPGFHPGDARSLSIRVRQDACVHRDPERHRHVRHQHENQVANWRELLAGTSVLDSGPTMLGIDMYGACNVKPPCVYCDWDTSKQMEGAHVDTPFTADTVERWGSLFAGASTLVNCSIGEPFMMRNLDGLFDIFGDRGKALEMATNGQILTDRNIEKLLGREIDLYVSLDAATPETYARLRNNTLDRILDNIRRLVRAKGGRGGLPRVHLIFMPMRCNVHELEAFVDLCAALQIDRLVLRPLNTSQSLSLRWEREGYVFDYPKEILPFEELMRVSARAAALARDKGVPFSDQMDFGVAMSEIFAAEFQAMKPERAPSGPAPTATSDEITTVVEPPAPADSDGPGSLAVVKLPACKEPWNSLYILRRGIYPCCYGGHPVAAMDEFGQAWNGKAVQEIRSELASGRFHRYCLSSPACPIVRKGKHAGTLPATQAVFLRGREFLQRVDRRLYGMPARVYRALRRVARRLAGR